MFTMKQENTTMDNMVEYVEMPGYFIIHCLTRLEVYSHASGSVRLDLDTAVLTC